MYNNNDDTGGVFKWLIGLMLFGFVFLAFGAMANSKEDGIYIFSQVISGDVGDGSVAIAGHDNRVENEPHIAKENPYTAFDMLGFVCGGAFILMLALGLLYMFYKSLSEEW